MDRRSEYAAETGRRLDFGRCSVLLLPLMAAAGWVACAGEPAAPRRPVAQCDARPKFRDSDFAAHEVDFFDRLVTPGAVLTDPARLRASHALPPLSKNGQRHYTFILDRLSAMDPTRHFDVITVSVARAGTLVKKRSAAPETSGVGAANGTFADATLQTSDGAYDLRVSEGRLLPEGLPIAPIDVLRAVLDLAQRYERALNARRTGTCGERDLAPLSLGRRRSGVMAENVTPGAGST